MRLEGKVAIIAGAAWGGIGGASAVRFAEQGAKVVVNTLRREDKLRETVERVEAVGGEAVAVMGDVSDEDMWRRVVDAALSNFGKVTTLLHNAAGGGAHGKRAAEFTLEEWNRGLAVTLGGPFLGAKYCIPEMVKLGGGSIIFTSSVNGTITNPLFANYSSSKAGVQALARSIAVDHGRDGIRCNSIAPGQIVGERGEKWMLDSPEEAAACNDCYPLGRYGRPDDIAHAAVFLASDESAFVTGITLTVDGGLTLQSPEALVRPSFRLRWRDDILAPQKVDDSGTYRRPPRR